MAATDYTIIAGLFNLYFAKKLKGDKISDDRRVITDNEILAMTEWYLRKEIEERKEKDPGAPNTIEVTRGGKKVMTLTLIDNEDNKNNIN